MSLGEHLQSAKESLVLAQASQRIPSNESGTDYKEELATIQKEQDDLLELLADQQNKLKEYGSRLRDLGEEVTDESEEEDSDDESD